MASSTHSSTPPLSPPGRPGDSNAGHPVSPMQINEIKSRLKKFDSFTASDRDEHLADTLPVLSNETGISQLIGHFLQTGSDNALFLIIKLSSQFNELIFDEIKGVMKNKKHAPRAIILLGQVIHENPECARPLVRHSAFYTILQFINRSHSNIVVEDIGAILFLATLMPYCGGITEGQLRHIFDTFINAAAYLLGITQDRNIPKKSIASLNICHLQFAVRELFLALYGIWPYLLINHLRSYFKDLTEYKTKLLNEVFLPLFNGVKLHPFLLFMDKETELDMERWEKREPHDFLDDCRRISIGLIPNAFLKHPIYDPEADIEFVQETTEELVQQILRESWCAAGTVVVENRSVVEETTQSSLLAAFERGECYDTNLFMNTDRRGINNHSLPPIAENMSPPPSPSAGLVSRLFNRVKSIVSKPKPEHVPVYEPVLDVNVSPNADLNSEASPEDDETIHDHESSTEDLNYSRTHSSNSPTGSSSGLSCSQKDEDEDCDEDPHKCHKHKTKHKTKHRKHKPRDDGKKKRKQTKNFQTFYHSESEEEFEFEEDKLTLNNDGDFRYKGRPITEKLIFQMAKGGLFTTSMVEFSDGDMDPAPRKRPSVRGRPVFPRSSQPQQFCPSSWKFVVPPLPANDGGERPATIVTSPLARPPGDQRRDYCSYVGGPIQDALDHMQHQYPTPRKCFAKSFAGQKPVVYVHPDETGVERIEELIPIPTKTAPEFFTFEPISEQCTKDTAAQTDVSEIMDYEETVVHDSEEEKFCFSELMLKMPYLKLIKGADDEFYAKLEDQIAIQHRENMDMYMATSRAYHMRLKDLYLCDRLPGAIYDDLSHILDDLSNDQKVILLQARLQLVNQHLLYERSLRLLHANRNKTLYDRLMLNDMLLEELKKHQTLHIMSCKQNKDLKKKITNIHNYFVAELKKQKMLQDSHLLETKDLHQKIVAGQAQLAEKDIVIEELKKQLNNQMVPYCLGWRKAYDSNAGAEVMGTMLDDSMNRIGNLQKINQEMINFKYKEHDMKFQISEMRKRLANEEKRYRDQLNNIKKSEEHYRENYVELKYKHDSYVQNSENWQHKFETIEAAAHNSIIEYDRVIGQLKEQLRALENKMLTHQFSVEHLKDHIREMYKSLDCRFILLDEDHTCPTPLERFLKEIQHYQTEIHIKNANMSQRQSLDPISPSSQGSDDNIVEACTAECSHTAGAPNQESEQRREDSASLSPQDASRMRSETQPHFVFYPSDDQTGGNRQSL